MKHKFIVGIGILLVLIMMLLYMTACTKKEYIDPPQKSRAKLGVPSIDTQLVMLNYRAPTTLFLDFDGDSSNTGYGCPGALPASFSDEDKDSIVSQVRREFSFFNVRVTRNSNEADPSRHVHVIITDSYAWYGFYGGCANTGSFRLGLDNACYVFPPCLQYNPSYTSFMIAHEIGHIFNLAHQSVYYEDCTLQTEFNIGDNSSTPFMSKVTSKPGAWWRGTSIRGCHDIQDDIHVIDSTLNQ